LEGDMENTYGLLKLQKANMKILIEIDRICKRHGIKYYLDAGTLLGAIRHGGFIPWDDDADIAMTRENYEKFKKVAKKELPSDMSLLLPTAFKKGRAFYDFTPRVIYNKSRRHKPDEESEYYEEKLNHIWVDVFILDNLPNNRFFEGFARNIQKLIYLFSMGHRYKIEFKKYPILFRPIIFVFTSIGKFISMRSLFKLQSIFARMANNKETKNLFYSNYQPDYLHIVVKREWISKLIDIRFEESSLSIPDEYEEILKSVYGDYMKLPEVEKRIPSHKSLEIEVYE
jgi:hypothetical protein